MKVIEETTILKKLTADKNKILISKELDSNDFPLIIAKEVYINDDEEANNFYEVELQS